MDELKHVGVLGMKWGKRKAKKQEKLKAKVEARKKALERVQKSGQANIYVNTYYLQGEKKANRILDRMVKNPKLDYSKAYDRDTAASFAKYVAIAAGAATVGEILARAGR